MSVGATKNYLTSPFIIGGYSLTSFPETIAQIIGRAIDLEQYTLMYKNPSTRKWGPITTVDPVLTRGHLTCGALGCSEAALAAISDGEFAIDIDGNEVEVTGLDFSVMDAPTDTRAKMVCGTNGGVIGAYKAVTAGTFRVTVNGVQRNLTALDFSGATAFADVLNILNEKLLPYNAYMEYNEDSNVFTLFSMILGDQSTLTVLSATGAGTDISGTGFLNGLTGVGTVTNGTGGTGFGVQAADIINTAALGKLTCEFDGSKFRFFSPTLGVGSTASVLSAVSGGGGTDISGAGYLNGLTGTGVATAGTGGGGEDIPMGIYIGQAVTAAALAAADVTYCQIMIGGSDVRIASDLLVIENSLTLNSVVQVKQKTIADCLQEINIYVDSTRTFGNYEI